MSTTELNFRALEREEGTSFLLTGAKDKQSSTIGTVHSVYKSVINVVDDQKFRLSLGAKSVVLGPGMIRIDGDHDFTSPIANIKPGNRIEKIGEKLVFSERVTCDLSTATTTSLVIPKISPTTLLVTKDVITDVLMCHGKHGGAARPWLLYATGRGTLLTLHEEAFYEGLQALSYLASIGEEKMLYECLGSLIGLGIGLTPTADDFATGFFTFMLAARPAFRQWVEQYRSEWLASIRGQTTFLGYEMLQQVLNGKVNKAAFDVLLSCIQPIETYWETRMKSLIALGSTSGTDMLAGMAFGLETLLVWKRREGNED